MKKAFSLFELSIVILIIAVIIIGITQSGSLVKKSRLATAQALTENSIVNNLDGLLAWYETSLESSFLASEIGDGNLISSWMDNNSKAVNKNHATQATSANKPKFYENVFNGAIPAMRFDGTNDLMDFDGSALASSAYSIFVVEQRRSSAGDNYFIGGTTIAANSNLLLGYIINTTVTQGHYANDLDVAIAAYSAPIARIHTFSFDTTNGKNHFINGASIGSAAQLTALASYSGAALGRYSSSFYNGDIAEVIIFKTKLKSEDRAAVEIYLSKKYGIKFS